MKAPVPLVLLLGFCAVASPAVGQAPNSGADAVRNIDWINMPAFSPIPDSFPTGDSDDPVEAGFAPRWIEHSLQPENSPLAQFALKITSSARRTDDSWSHEMPTQLRALIRAKVPNGKNTRVFCNSIGCLCYVERDEPGYVTTPVMYPALRGQAGRELHLSRHDIRGVIQHVHRPGVPWELTIIRHPAESSAAGASQTGTSSVTPNNRWRGP